MGSADEESTQLLVYDELIDLLDLLTKTSEKLFTVISTLPANATTTADLEVSDAFALLFAFPLNSGFFLIVCFYYYKDLLHIGTPTIGFFYSYQ